MKILFIASYNLQSSTNNASPGALRKIGLTLDAIIKAGHEVIVLDSSQNTTTYDNDYHIKKGSYNLRFITPPKISNNRKLNKIYNAFGRTYWLQEFSEVERIDLVWIYNSYIFEARSALMLDKKLNIPFVLQLEDHPMARNRGWGNFKSKLDNMYFTRLCKMANIVFAVNSKLLKMTNSQTGYLYPPIIAPEIERLSSAQKLERKAPGSTIRVGYFGGLSEDKGVRVLFESIGSCPDNIEFNISGKGLLESEILSLEKKYPHRLKFHGFINDADYYSLLTSMDIVVNPHTDIKSMQDGIFPSKLLEYIGSGALVISTAVPKLNGLDLDTLTYFDGTKEQLIKLIKDYSSLLKSHAQSNLRETVLDFSGFEATVKLIQKSLAEINIETKSLKHVN